MSERLHLDFVCGVTNFPHDSRGRPIWSASRSDNVYPQYVPPEQPGPITEWQEAPLHDPVRVPLPDKVAILATLRARVEIGTTREYTASQWRDDRHMYDDLLVHARLRKAAADELPETVGPEAIDIVYWQGWQAPDNDDAAAGVIGYVVDRLPYDDTMAYAFGTIYPAISQKFAGHAILPSIPLDQAGSADSLFLRFLIEQASSDPTFYAQMLKRSHWREVQRRGISLRTINRQKQLIRDGHLYQHFLIETDPILATTMWIFNWMGLRVRKRDLRLILCWHWS